MLAKIAWIGFIRSSSKYEPSQRRKNRTKKIPEDHGDQREPREVQGHDQQVEREHAQEQHRQQILRCPEPIDLVHRRGGLCRAGSHVLAPCAWLLMAALSGLVGSCVRSWMIDIPTAQIRATMAVGYKKITLGHMKIRIPCSRCGAAGTAMQPKWLASRPLT